MCQPRRCYCHIPDLRALRLAAGLREREWCALLGLTKGELYRLEHGPHRCPHRSTLLLLTGWMGTEAYRRRLQAAGVPIPPEPPLDWAS